MIYKNQLFLLFLFNTSLLFFHFSLISPFLFFLLKHNFHPIYNSFFFFLFTSTMDLPPIFSPLSIDNLPPLNPSTPSDFSIFMDYFETNVLQNPRQLAPTLDFSTYSNEEILQNLQSAISTTPSTPTTSTKTNSSPLTFSSSPKTSHNNDQTTQQITQTSSPKTPPPSSPLITLSPASSTTIDIDNSQLTTVATLPPPPINLPFPFPIFS